MTCFSCKNYKICYFRTAFAEAIQSFKLLANDSVEASNTGKNKSVQDIFHVVAESCTIYEQGNTK